MTRTHVSHQSDLQTELARLREELSMRDQLVQQLSQELFRLVKGNTLNHSQAESPENQHYEIRSLREQLREIEQQVDYYQAQVNERDAEIQQLKSSAQEMNSRSQMLEQVVQEMPRIYKEKFAERMIPIKEKVARIQRENRQLHAELQSVSYRLAVRNRRITHLDLPSFPRIGQSSTQVPSLSDV